MYDRPGLSRSLALAALAGALTWSPPTFALEADEKVYAGDPEAVEIAAWLDPALTSPKGLTVLRAARSRATPTR